MIPPNFLIVGAAKAGTTSLWHYFQRASGNFHEQGERAGLLQDP
jgi:hypothetical protein